VTAIPINHRRRGLRTEDPVGEDTLPPSAAAARPKADCGGARFRSRGQGGAGKDPFTHRSVCRPFASRRVSGAVIGRPACRFVFRKIRSPLRSHSTAVPPAIASLSNDVRKWLIPGRRLVGVMNNYAPEELNKIAMEIANQPSCCCRRMTCSTVKKRSYMAKGNYS
jgi:hypothetical protein